VFTLLLAGYFPALTTGSGCMLSSTSYRLALVTSFLAFAASYLFSLVGTTTEKQNNTDPIPVYHPRKRFC